MHLASFFSRYTDLVDRFLNYLERTFWQNDKQIDTTTPIFYVYKAYPANTNNKQRESWVKLQEKALSPYKNGGSFSVPLPNGVAMWLARDTFKAVPETARQHALPDGSWFVRGAEFTYRQTWKDGVMLRCDMLPSETASHDTLPINENPTMSSWALPRNVDVFLKSPFFGLSVVGLIAALVSLWLITAFVVISIETSVLKNKVKELESTLGTTLETKDVFQRDTRHLEQLNAWKSDVGYLPLNFGNIVSTVNAQTPWVAGKIIWQDKTLTVTLFSEELDITTLVEKLEGTGAYESVSIRPQDNSNLWTLEVVTRV